MGVSLLDSDVVVGFLDSDDPLHAQADAAIRAVAPEHRFVVSFVTVAEVLTGAKLGHHDEATVRRFFDQVVSARLPLDGPTAERAAELRAAHRPLKMPDALILATADINAEVVLSADERALKAPGLRCELRSIVHARPAT